MLVRMIQPCCTKLCVDNLCPVLIGRGGSKKRDMEEESGARINIKEVDGEGSVDITGEESARNKAKQIIEAIVRLV